LVLNNISIELFKKSGPLIQDQPVFDQANYKLNMIWYWLLKELKYFLVQFSSPFCKYLNLKLRWSAIKIGSMLVHTIF